MAYCEKRGDSYRIIVTDGYDINGNQIRHKLTYKPDKRLTPSQLKKELEKVKLQFEEEVRNGTADLSNTRFADFCKIFMEDYAEKNLKISSLTNYKNHLPNIIKAFGHIKLKDLNRKHFNDFYKNLAEKGVSSRFSYTPNDLIITRINEYKRLEGSFSELSRLSGIGRTTIEAVRKGENIEKPQAEKLCNALDLDMKDCFKKKTIRLTLSNSSIWQYHRHISAILNKAVQWGYIEKNPSQYAVKPKLQEKIKKLPDYETTLRLANCLESEPIKYKAIFLLFLYSGMRKGELLGLEWEDIDFDNETINIERASQYISHMGVLTVTPKNKHSERVIKLPSIIFNLLRELRVWQSEERLMLGSKWNNSDRLFTTWNGKPMNPSSVNKWFTDFLKRNDLPHMTIHELRHLNASIMIMQLTPVTEVQGRLGHAKASTTMSIYAHAIKSAQAQAVDSIDDFLRRAK